MQSRTVLFALVAACAPADDPATSATSGTTSPTPAPTTASTPPTPTTPTLPTTTPTDTALAGTATTGDTGTVLTTTTPPVDCTALAPLPVTYDTLNWVASAEDFTFSPDGTMLAVHGGNLKSTEWGGVQQLLVPNLGDVRGTRMLPDGRLAMAHIETGSVLIVDPATGSQVVHSGMVNPNGIAIGDDGWVYVATTERILRVEPDTGEQEVVAERAGKSFDGISFSPDYSRLYFNEEVGRVHWVDFDASGVPGPIQDGPTVPIGAFSLLDGMAVDACGNLYTTEMGSTVWRIAVDGTVEKVVEISGVAILPALNFGTGIGGWDAEKLYVMDFLGKMYELDVAVPGKPEPHLP